MTRKNIRRIATEEAFNVKPVANELRRIARGPSDSQDMALVRMIYDTPAGTEPTVPNILEHLLDLEGERIRDMDENGVAVQLLSLTAPGVQMFDADMAVELAAQANDILAGAIARHPTRLAGLAAFAPHAPRRAALEMERAIRKLKLNGFIVSSHTHNQYLDDPLFYPILEAAEALDGCIYIHPRAPSSLMAGVTRLYGMESALWGYNMEVNNHAMRLIYSGVFDRFPKLKICIGHMGEGVPFLLWRQDYWVNRAGRERRNPPLELLPSEYFERNFVITTSGMEDPLALDFCIKKIGADKILWAIDYPYQPTAPAVAFLDNAPITEEQREMIYWKNAARVFHIGN